jgi:UDP-N-acetylmuramyl pentapeptide phosphotransferase/UDP-N-acetylglucosamine-1-phosphate transferase
LPHFEHAHFLIAMTLTLAIAWMTNLYNFMDGSDGLAGGMSAIGFGAYAIAAWQSGVSNVALPSIALASACAAFLLFNFPPARLFMGDAGSIPLGFVAGALGVHGAVTEIWPAWFPLLVFSPFVVDASVTLARRAVSGEPFWRAHRTHYYQRLVLGGWSSRRLALGAYAVMLAASVSAIAACSLERETQYAIIGLWSAMYFASIVAIERRAPQSASQRGRGTR